MSPEDFAAGVDALIPILSILATGTVTILGGWATARWTRRNDMLKLEAERDREKDRLAHEDAIALRALEAANEKSSKEQLSAQANEQAERAKIVADRFLEVVRIVRDHDPGRGDDAEFAPYFARHWDTANEIELRREIGMLTDAPLRDRLNNLVMAMDDYYMASRHGSKDKYWARWLSEMGANFALAAARRQEPDSENEQTYARFFDTFTDVWQERYDEG
jgi:hypothetical protein